MSTACWGTNNSFDCAWITFGWGSRWDMIDNTYEKGFWLSLEALKAFLIYDLPNCQHFPYNEEEPNGSPAPADGDYYTKEEWLNLEPQHQMLYTGFRIDHPEGIAKNIEWYLQAREVCGQFKLNNPTSKFAIPKTCTIIGGPDLAPLTETDYPYPHQIFDLNQVHGEIIKRTYEQNAIALESSPRTRGWLGVSNKIDETEFCGPSRDQEWE